MPANFPDSPTLNQTYTYNSATWLWDGTVWTVVASGAAATAQSTQASGIFLNANVIPTSTTLSGGYNGLSAGPVSLAANVTVTVSAGAVWTVV